ncbi:copper chaperone PCu(A)C [Amycolatopsis palatopharyngis]|uniref:copper chaperone PCu(A)C n=1 Tax=Amycolatopsis palatopharyngis TaxID=187982 RepID=UPI0014759812|nr:copper chaperone PCu(A)C [Amycolatopsis palatopharyngis]
MRQQNRRALGLRKMSSVVAGLGAVLFIAGCGAGQITQTDSQEAAINGAKADVGKIAVRDAELAFPEPVPGATTDSGQPVRYFPAGSQIPVELVIVNEGDVDDELLSVTSDAAGSVAVQGDRRIVAGSILAVGQPEYGEAAALVDPPTETDSGSTALAPSGGESPGNGHASIVLEQLVREVWPGQSITVTLTFKNAGSATLDIPITAPAHPRVADVEHGESEGGH